ncbi:hypothetical protein [Aeromicrobium ginsengisoli]|uniref:Uncharacterized protein n=1 Tax=Aeromicrobium ginsengisoli TaxID=363867 RepID=A0A5M4FE82_9ACTN|nr:hypothetical protein [Aeromicrobium ginsengisoli]KAA1397528.1 hypothetical protein ESP70_009135 [Aeromicrobium ginsengisoli]
MTLRPLADVSPAEWFVGDDAPTALRAHLGPSGFESYVRVLHSPMGPDDDRYEGHLEEHLLDALCEVLARHTATPNDCFFGLWDGYGELYGGEAVRFLTAFSGPTRWPSRMFGKEKPPPPVPPAFPISVLEGPKVTFFHDYLLFGGALAEAGEWGATSYGHAISRDINSPNLMWPADRAWFVTTNIESTWTGVGGTAALIGDLLADPRLEVVRMRYDEGALR